MEYQNKLSRLRQAFLKLQGQDLKQVLLRAAAKEASFVADSVYTSEEIFHAISEKIYEATNELSWNTAFELVSDAESLAILKKELIEDVAAAFQWEETLHVLLEGLEGGERNIVKAVLKNQHSYQCLEADMMRGSGVVSDSAFVKLLVPIARRIFHNFEALKLVGVQPMTAPVSLAYLLRYQQIGDEGKREDIDDTATGRKITLEVVSQAIEARTRTLNAGWTIEASQDLNIMHALDIESEIIQALSTEIQEELTAEIVGNLRKLAGDPEEIELDGFESTTPVKLAVRINCAANDIAVQTRRGAGNWIVVSPIMVSMFETDLPEGTYKKKEGDKSSGLFGSLMEVGTLNGTIKVFSSWSAPTDEVLVGYKGKNGETDAGYVYAPYVPVMSAGIVTDSETFQPVIKLMTRNGMALNGDFQYDEDGNKIDMPPKAQNYYNLIKIKGNLFTEEESSK